MEVSLCPRFEDQGAALSILIKTQSPKTQLDRHLF